MKVISIRIPKMTNDQINDLKKYYKKHDGTITELTTSDIIRRSVNVNYQDKILPFNKITDDE